MNEVLHPTQIRITDANAHFPARVLQIVGEKKDPTAKTLANQMGVSQATVTALVDKLVARELVSRQPSAQDRRQTNITLTTKGEDVLEEAPDALQQRYVRAFADLADWEQAQLVSSLERVAAMLNVDSLDAAPVLATGELRTSKKAY